MPTSADDATRRIEVLLSAGADGDLAERIAAEAWAEGASGLEERAVPSERGARAASPGATLLLLYAPASEAERVRAAVLSAAGDAARVGPAEAVESTDWSEAWKEGLAAIEIGERLLVRASFVEERAREPERLELCIDPGQAFGTGAHASTGLALEWIELLSRQPGFADATRVLDVGAGTGILALAALRLGAGSAVAFDLDRQATLEAGVWARANALEDRLAIFAGPIDALRGAHFDLVVANLLRSEMEPIATALVAAVAPQGRLVLSGLLAPERDRVAELLSGLPVGIVAERSARDANGDEWLALLCMRDTSRA